MAHVKLVHNGLLCVGVGYWEGFMDMATIMEINGTTLVLGT
jgi:hypothetical protein